MAPSRRKRVRDIKVGGDPSAPWHLQTGSGSVELWAGNAPMTLDASTGSGNVHTDREMLTQGSIDKHHITGKLNGGGTDRAHRNRLRRHSRSLETEFTRRGKVGCILRGDDELKVRRGVPMGAAANRFLPQAGPAAILCASRCVREGFACSFLQPSQIRAKAIF